MVLKPMWNPFTSKLDWIEELLRDLVNGSFREFFNALVTSNGTVVTMTLTNASGGNLIMQFSDGDTILDLSSGGTIALTAGSDSSPTSNYIYIPKSTKVLTKSTTGFPTTVEHIKVGYFLVGSATYVQADGAYINQNWNDGLQGIDNQGHLLHMAEKSRRDGAYYFSGIGPGGTDDSSNSSYFDYVSGTEAYFKSTSGIVYQMHPHSYPAKDTRSGSDDIHVVNWNGDSYHDIHDLTDITDDATGSTLNNRFFNLTFFGVANKSGEYGPILVNLPTGSYANQKNAERDVDNYDVLTMPREFNLESSTGFLICRITFKITSGNWSHKSTIDLRGQTPITASGGAAGTTTEFADNQFKVFDEADITKILTLDVGTLLTTGNTRTLQVPDASGILALIDLAQTWSASQTYNDDVKHLFGTGADGEIYVNADDLYIKNVTQDKDIIFSFDDGGVTKTITLDASANTLIFDDDTALNLGAGNIGTTGTGTFNKLVITSANDDFYILGSGDNTDLGLDSTPYIRFDADGVDIYLLRDVFATGGFAAEEMLVGPAVEVNLNYTDIGTETFNIVNDAGAATAGVCFDGWAKIDFVNADLYTETLQGQSQTVSVRKGDDSGACNLVFTNGLLTSTTC